jgi:hypothetical protein
MKMAIITTQKYVCNGCGKELGEDLVGAIELRGSITRVLNYVEKNIPGDEQYITDKNISHFCSWKCLMGYNGSNSKKHLEDPEYKKLISDKGGKRI